MLVEIYAVVHDAVLVGEVEEVGSAGGGGRGGDDGGEGGAADRGWGEAFVGVGVVG